MKNLTQPVYYYPFIQQLIKPGGYWVHAGSLVVSLRSAYREIA